MLTCGSDECTEREVLTEKGVCKRCGEYEAVPSDKKDGCIPGLVVVA